MDLLTFIAAHSLEVLLMSSTFGGCRYVELREQGLKADLVTYNTLLKACMRSANLPCAEVVMAWLQQQGLQVSLSHPSLWRLTYVHAIMN